MVPNHATHHIYNHNVLFILLIFNNRVRKKYRNLRDPEVFYKKDGPRNFTKFTGKHLYQGFFFNKVAGSSLQLYLKSDSGTGVFL